MRQNLRVTFFLKFFLPLVCAATAFADSSVAANESSLHVTWFGATCLHVSDGETSILFDPFFTRPSLWSVVSFKALRSNREEIESWLSKAPAPKITTLILSHSHYDHILDMPYLAKSRGAKVYGSLSAKNIALGQGVAERQITDLSKVKSFKTGQFKVRVYRGSHPPHFLGLTLAAGRVKSPLPEGASAYAYKKGMDFAFYIEHPKGNIVFHPSGETALAPSTLKQFDAKLLVVGIANRKSSLDLLKNLAEPLKPNFLVPVHFDNIFKPLEPNIENLMGVDLQGFKDATQKILPEVQYRQLSVGETLKLN